MLQPRSFPTIAGVIACLCLLFFLYSSHSQPITRYPAQIVNSYATKYRGLTEDIRTSNGTLGFEKVFAVGLKERSDKRDALTLISSLTGFKIDWINGIRGEEVVDKALPFGVDRVQLWENNVGSWRGHMNAVRQ